VVPPSKETSSQPTPLHADLETETDEFLLLCMALREEDRQRAETALTVFYERHCEYLHGVCYRKFESDSDGSKLAADFVQETFIRAYERAETFDQEPDLTADEARRSVRAWLGTIAKNLFLSHRDADTQLLPPEQWQNLDGRHAEEERSEDPEHWSDERRLLEEALDTLNEKERIVMQFTYAYYRPSKEHQRLPNHVAQQIAEMIDTKPSTLRKIRQRAHEKIKRYVSEHRDR
jgi:RNA polymerase sigma factor (sigma-70 family)